jgi:hypothetical protein
MAGDQDTSIKITGDASEFVKEADKGAQSINKIGVEAEKVNKANPLKSIATGAANAIGPVTGLVSRIGALAGQFTILVGIVTGVVAVFDYFVNAADRARAKAQESAKETAKLREEMEKLGAVNTTSDSPEKLAVTLAERLDGLAEKYKKLRLELSANEAISGEDRMRLNVELRKQEAEEFAKLNRAVETNNRLLEAAETGGKQAAQRKALREALEEEIKLQRQLEDEQATATGRIENERKRAIEAVRAKQEFETDAEIRSALDRQIGLINQVYNARIQKSKEAVDKEKADERKRIDETSRREQDAIRQVAAAQAAFSQGTEATYQSNSLDLLQQIAQGIQSINQRQ